MLKTVRYMANALVLASCIAGSTYLSGCKEEVEEAPTEEQAEQHQRTEAVSDELIAPEIPTTETPAAQPEQEDALVSNEYIPETKSQPRVIYSSVSSLYPVQSIKPIETKLEKIVNENPFKDTEDVETQLDLTPVEPEKTRIPLKEITVQDVLYSPRPSRNQKNPTLEDSITKASSFSLFDDGFALYDGVPASDSEWDNDIYAQWTHGTDGSGNLTGEDNSLIIRNIDEADLEARYKFEFQIKDLTSAYPPTGWKTNYNSITSILTLEEDPDVLDYLEIITIPFTFNPTNKELEYGNLDYWGDETSGTLENIAVVGSPLVIPPVNITDFDLNSSYSLSLTNLVIGKNYNVEDSTNLMDQAAWTVAKSFTASETYTNITVNSGKDEICIIRVLHSP